MALTAQPTPDLPENTPKENSTQIGQGVDAKGIVDNSANEVGEDKMVQNAPTLHQIAAKKILAILEGMTLTDVDISIGIVKAWLPAHSYVQYPVSIQWGLVKWEHTDHKNESFALNADENDNTSVYLEKVRFHVRLTFNGLIYITGYLRLKKQDTFTIIGILIAALTTVFIIISAIAQKNDKTPTEIQNLKEELKSQRQLIRKLDFSLQEINSSIQKIQTDTFLIKKGK